MPGSSTVGQPEAFELIAKGCEDITTILDVGPGSGQWFDFLHRWYPFAVFDAVEIFEPYVERYQLRRRYSTVFVGDVRRWQRHLTYDLVIFGDVLEHMTKPEAIEVVNRLLHRYAIISVPLGVCPQEPTEENPHEEHVSTWMDKDEVLRAFPQIKGWSVTDDPRTGDGIGRGMFLLERTS
jgi:trans-aconitate methyltransferase